MQKAGAHTNEADRNTLYFHAANAKCNEKRNQTSGIKDNLALWHDSGSEIEAIFLQHLIFH